MSRVAILGTGYVGSVTGACLAEKGYDVSLVDLVPWKVDRINSGLAPIEERGLDSLISEGVQNGNLRATLDLAKAVEHADIVQLCIQTPPLDNGRANLEHLHSAVDELSSMVSDETVVVTRSTVPVGTTRAIGERLSAGAGFVVPVANNPEFLAEGTAVRDTQNPSRIIIGTESDLAELRLRELYHPFVSEAQRIIKMDPESSEMSKLFANGILASDITFANIVAEICEAVGADFTRVREGAGFDERIGRFTKAGPGFGGSCFPKDIRSLASIAKDVNLDSTYLNEITAVNEYMQERMAYKIKRALGLDNLEDTTVAVLGLAFKADTDDMRESPALALINRLTEEGAQVVAYDPKAMDEAKRIFADNDLVTFADDKYKAAEGADALAIVTEWGEFTTLDLNHLAQIMNRRIIIDGRHVLKLSSLRGKGFYYDAIGRPLINELET